jgi:hypothetical protein
MYVIIPVAVVLGAMVVLDILTDGSRRNPQPR